MFRFVLILLFFKLSVTQTSPVVVTIYYESKCFGSQSLLTKTLPLALKKFGSSIVVDLVPYGNADTKWVEDHWEVECHHGEEECYGNRLGGCALQDGSVDFNSKFNFISCLAGIENFSRNGPNCAKLSGLSWTKINSCAHSDEGQQYLLAYGGETNQFFSQGGMQWTPYVAYNNVKNDDVGTDALGNFVATTCKHLTDPKPEICYETK